MYTDLNHLYGFDDEMLAKITGFFKVTLKLNFAIMKALIAGVSPIRNYLPNNVNAFFTVYDTMLDYAFGFVESEVKQLMNESIQGVLFAATNWYSNFRIGKQDIQLVFDHTLRKQGWVIKQYATPPFSFQKLPTRLFKDFGLLPPINFQKKTTGKILKKRVAERFNFKLLSIDEETMWT